MKTLFSSFAVFAFLVLAFLPLEASAESASVFRQEAAFTPVSPASFQTSSGFSLDSRRRRVNRRWCVRRRRACARLADRHRCRSSHVKRSDRCGGWRCFGYRCRF